MSSTEATIGPHTVLPVRPEGIPEYLRARPQWVCWRFEDRDGKPTKVPYDPVTGERASTTDLMTWAPFAEAMAALEAGRFDGVGFCFSSADPFCGIDLDGCRDPESGAIEPWARAIIEKFDGAYVEASPSATGVHIIARGRLGGGARRGPVELYDQARYFCLTGVTL